MHLHLVQFAIENLEPARNRERVRELLGDTEIPPGSLIVLPELFSTGTLPPDYTSASADSVIEDDRVFLAELANTWGAHVLGGCLGRADNADGKLYNLTALVDPEGREVLEYRKIHPFSYGGEDRLFEGGAAVRLHAVEGFSLFPTVCYDLRFPELYRLGVERGADLMTVQANWPASRQEHWEVLLRARAIENQCVVAGVNCVGVQQGTAYAGGSRIVSPKGSVLASGGDDEEVVSAEISHDAVRAWRSNFPALRDRRPAAFWGEL